MISKLAAWRLLAANPAIISPLDDLRLFPDARQLKTYRTVSFHHKIGQICRPGKLGIHALYVFFSDPTGHAAGHSKIKGDFVFYHPVDEFAQRWKAYAMDGIGNAAERQDVDIGPIRIGDGPL